VEHWIAKLEAREPDAAWDLLLERYRRLIFAAIRHYTTDPDDVMDVFARVCEALRADDLARLRQYAAQPAHRARFSTWLVTVVRHLTIDWFRHRDGRPRLSAAAAALPPAQRRIFEYVFVGGRSHIEAYELLRTRDAIDLPFGAFLHELSATYRAAAGATNHRGRLVVELGGPPPLPGPDPPDDDAAVRAEQAGVLADALAALTPDERLAVELFVIEEVPAAEVARLVGLPNAKAVYNRVYRALAAVRLRLERAGIRRDDL